jgi:stress response protein YsnF
VQSSVGGAKPTAAGERERAIPVVEEELQVGKRAVNRGGVRVFSRVVEKPVEEHVQLREENVTVE